MKSFAKTALTTAFALAASAAPLLAQSDVDQPASQGSAIGGIIGGVIGLAVAVLMVVAMWKVFTKAGKPGWASLIPIYNTVVLLEIVGRPIWWILLCFIPFVNFIIIIILMIDLAKSFGKGGGFAAGLILLLPIFILILAFGDARYVGPAAARK